MLHRPRRISVPGLLLVLLVLGGSGVAHAQITPWWDTDVTVANLNILHGFACPSCRLADRMALLGDWVEDRNCPDVLTFQEVIQGGSNNARTLIQAEVAAACAEPYQSRYSSVSSIDEELTLSRYEILDSNVLILHPTTASFNRHVLHTRIDHPAGLLEVFTTHLSSGSDGATDPCDYDFDNDTIIDEACPTSCVNAGATTIRECQSVQLLDWVDVTTDPDANHVLVTGDFNAVPGSFEYDHWIVTAGWTDTHLAAAGGMECNPGTGADCTSGRDDTPAALESTAITADRRIDYIFHLPRQTEPSCEFTLDSPGDADADGVSTGLFGHIPNPFETCGALPLPICWISDHNGNEADIEVACVRPVPSSSLPSLWLSIASVLGVSTLWLLRARFART